MTGPNRWNPICVALLLSLTGCAAPSERLTFPDAPLTVSDTARLYDVDSDGVPDFALRADAQGRFDILAYDDDEDGVDDRAYRLSDYDPDRVPHVVLMLDSIPYRTVRDRYERGDWPWFQPPAKVIPPFPTASDVIFGHILHTAPESGVMNHHYRRRLGQTEDRISMRAAGRLVHYEHPLTFRLPYWQNALMFLSPDEWYLAELAMAAKAVDRNPYLLSTLYIVSPTGLVSAHGEAGANRTLDRIEQFCMQLMWERRGAVRITVLADHGHNYIPGERFELIDVLSDGGFHVTQGLAELDDVVIEVDGLMNYVGLHTRRASRIADLLAAREEVQLVAYQRGERIIVRNAHGSAAVEHRDGRYRYAIIDHDVLGYTATVDVMRHHGLADADGFATSNAWLESTHDHQYPDAPFRLWQAFHELVVNTPDVMVTLRDGYYYGPKKLEMFIDMASTHGGIDQANSTTFVMTTGPRVTGPLRSHDVLPALNRPRPSDGEEP